MESPVHVSPAGDGTLTVALRGEIDYSNAASVVDTIVQAVTQARPDTVRVDMGQVTFLDSSGINVLVKVYRSATGAGAAYRVVGPNRLVYDQLAMTGLPSLFEVEPPAAPVA